MGTHFEIKKCTFTGAIDDVNEWNVNLTFQIISLKEANAEEKRLAARYSTDIDIAKSQRDFELKKAAYDMEIQTKKAQSDLAYDLQVIVCA